MAIFNSLGSNYKFSFVLKALLPSVGHHHLALRKFLETKYGGEAILLHKGREAIEFVLRIIQKIDNLPQGAAVAVNGFTCYALYKAIVNAGFIPAYIDIEDRNLNFSPGKLAEAVKTNPNIKAVIIQNTLGYPAAAQEIAKICAEKGLVLIEDVAHSVGTFYTNGQETGSFGDFAVFSFSQDKIVDAVSGGALVIRNQKYLIRAPYPLADLRMGTQFIERFYPAITWKIRVGYLIGIGKPIHWISRKLNLLSRPITDPNFQGLYRLPSWYCSLIKSRFRKLPENLAHRGRIAHIYRAELNSVVLSTVHAEQIQLANNLRFPIFVNNRAGLVDYLAKQKIFVSDIWYDAPVSPKKYLNLTNYQAEQCPEAERVSQIILNLPTHINVSEKDAHRITNLINQWLVSQSGR
ncbi:MAG: DegT/DnrJ/EryC1/StrS family aminotransferase [Candidatus Colwellbacteria bacterium]